VERKKMRDVNVGERRGMRVKDLERKRVWRERGK
jgi:hypothetical protein